MNLNFLNNFSFSGILSGFNKTLGVIKKSIPVYKEIRPYISKEKSLFKKDNEISLSNKPSKSNKYNDSLTFFQ
jgi:hypothetical protein